MRLYHAFKLYILTDHRCNLKTMVDSASQVPASRYKGRCSSSWFRCICTLVLCYILIGLKYPLSTTSATMCIISWSNRLSSSGIPFSLETSCRPQIHWLDLRKLLRQHPYERHSRMEYQAYNLENSSRCCYTSHNQFHVDTYYYDEAHASTVG